jgi:hypothetical protein
MNLLRTTCFSLLLSTAALAQTTITGTVTDQKGEAIAGANIYIKDSYDGTSSDAEGKFNFVTIESDSQQLVTSYIGYETDERKILASGSTVTLKIALKEIVNELNTVVITAGAFEASDERRITILRPLDIVTTAGAAGDIYGALQTLPGTQQIGDQTGLFVRGGDASEAKTFIDGVAVADPYFTGVPDIPQRGRFSPFLFKGTFFSTGGYSAQYGGAMSSALILESQDLPERTSTNISLMSVGAGISHIHKFKNTSVGIAASYTNLQPYINLIDQNYDWVKAPEAGSGSVIFRQKTSKTGLLKAFISYGPSHSIINYPDLNDTIGGITRYDVKNHYLFSNASYKELLGKKWTLLSSASYSKSTDDIVVDGDSVNSENSLLQGRITFSRPLGLLSTIRLGTEVQYPQYQYDFTFYSLTESDLYWAGYAEADIYITSKLVGRLGVRPEYSERMNQGNVAPRISIAYKTGKFSQVSVAYGQFYQSAPLEVFSQVSDPGNNVSVVFPDSFSHANHYILNYQVVSDKRTFRAEAYYKTYHDLPTFFPEGSSRGTGYASGLDLFWRDKKTIPYADYWISYSFLDTKREYLDYPEEAVPPFAATHTLSVVYKQTIPKINLNLGCTYVFSSGRTYYNPNNPVFLGDETPDYHNVSLNASYITTIFRQFTVIAISATNIFGFDHVHSYRYSTDGTNSLAIGDPAKRAYFIGMFMSIGEDRGDD